MLEERRRNARAPRPERVPPPEPVEAPELAAMDAEERERLHEAMRRLPEPYRGVALLRWRYGLEPAEIAEVRGVPPGTVWSWLHRALARLKVSMGALPALLLSFRSERGLDGVRRALLRQAISQAAATAASGAAAAAAVTTLGGFVMANKAIAVGAAALLLGAAGWAALRPGAPAPMPAGVPEVARAPAAPPPAPATPAPATSAADASPGTIVTLPPPVDLSKCDRDLDLFGEIVDGEGRPVPGASVEVEEYPWRALHSMNAAWRHEMRSGPRTLSASDGTFAIRLARGQSIPLRVRKEGLAERFLDKCLAGERLRIVLGRGADLDVTVRDAAGAPVPGTELRLWRVTDSNGIEIERRGTTDAAGRFVFDALTPGRAFLSAEHAKHALPNWAHPEIPETGTLAVEVAFPEAQVVTGKVTHARTGAPLAGARVGIGWTMEMPVTTAADGTYRMETWAPKQGRPELHARADGFVGWIAPVRESGDLDFELVPGDAVAGRLVDSSGAPLAGAFLSVLESRDPRGPRPPPHPWDTLHGRTGADGRFLLRGLDHAVPHTLLATVPGRGRVLLEFPPAPEEGGTTDFGDLVFGPGRALEGLVLDLAGEPAAGIGVVLKGRFFDRGRLLPGGTPSDPEPARAAEVRRTDDLGRFRFADLSPGHWIVSARMPGRPPLEKEVVVPADRDVLDVRLGGSDPNLAFLRFLAVDDAGAPVADVQFNVYPPGQQPVQATTDDAGKARVDGLTKTAHTVHVMLAEPLRDRFVYTHPGSVTPDGQELRLVLSESAEIRGVVVDEKGAPLEDLGVSAFRGEETAWCAFAFTDERGEFVLKAPRGSPLRIALSGTRKAPPGNAQRAHAVPSPFRGEVAGIAAPAAGVRIVAAERALNQRLEVVVLDVDGKPLASIPLSLQGGGPFKGARTDEAGKAVFDELPPDRTMLHIQPGTSNGLPEDFVPPPAQWLEPAGQTVTVRFTRGVVLRGRILLPDGSPAVGAIVSAFEPQKAITSVLVKSDADGRFRVAFPAGERPHINSSVKAADGQFLIGFKESVEPGAQDIEIRLHPKAR